MISIEKWFEKISENWTSVDHTESLFKQRHFQEGLASLEKSYLELNDALAGFGTLKKHFSKKDQQRYSGMLCRHQNRLNGILLDLDCKTYLTVGGASEDELRVMDDTYEICKKNAILLCRKIFQELP